MMLFIVAAIITVAAVTAFSTPTPAPTIRSLPSGQPTFLYLYQYASIAYYGEPVPDEPAIPPPDEHLIENMATTGGAEELNLLEVIYKNEAVFHAFLSALHVSPHVALGMVHFNMLPLLHNQTCGPSVVASLDELMYGSDEATSKGLLNHGASSMLAYLLAPGLLSCAYALSFFDTNPFLVSFLVSTYFVGDVVFYSELLLAVSGRRWQAAVSFVLRAVTAAVYALASFLAVTHLPELLAAVDDTFLLNQGSLPISLAALYAQHRLAASSALLALTLGLTALTNARRLRHLSASECRALWEHFAFSKSVVVRAKRGKVRAVLRSLKNQDLFDTSDHRKLYTCDVRKLGGGAFGDCFAGTVNAEARDLERVGGKGTLGQLGPFVALKIFKPRAKAEDVERAFSLFLRCLGGEGPGIAAGVSSADFLAAYQQQERQEVEEAKAEIRALRCVAALECPYLLQLSSAHKTSTEVVVVTQQLTPNPLGLYSAPLAVRLSAVQTFFAGVAELHAAGIVHRDLKIGNTGLSMQNLGSAVVIDFGAVELPYSDYSADKFMNTRDPRTAAPENSTAGLVRNAAFNLMLHGNQGPEGDVWAAGITAIEMLCCGRQDKKPYELRDVNHIFEFAGHRLTAMDGGAGSPPTPRSGRTPPSRRPCQWCEWEVDEISGERRPKEGNVHPLHTSAAHIEQLLYCVTYLWDEDDDEDEWVSGERPARVDVSALVDLLRSMLQMWRHGRITMQQARTHAFFRTQCVGEYAPPQAAQAAAPTSPSADRGDNRMPQDDAALSYESYESPPVKPRSESPSAPPSSFLPADGVVTAGMLLGPAVAAPAATVTNPNIRLMIDLAKFLHLQQQQQQQQQASPTSPPSSPRRSSSSSSSPDESSPRSSFVDSLQAAMLRHATSTQQLTLEQLKSVLSEASLPPNIARLPMEDLFALLDVDSSGTVDRCELFSGLVILLAPFACRSERLSLLFKAFDSDSNDSLSRAELAKLLATYGFEEDPSSLFSRLDQDGDGELSFQEFCSWAEASDLIA